MPSSIELCPACGATITPGEWCTRCMVALALGAETPPMMVEPLGSIASYDLKERIAQGGMGVVYKAHQPALERSVALKLLAPHATGSADALRRFQTETAAAASLQHPNILPIYESGEENGQAFYSMPLMDGGTLADRLPGHPIDPKEAARLMRKIAAAVAHAHQQGVLHRDLKPQNIFLDTDSEPYVADFGLAKILTQETALTLSGAVLGTPAYMAPEQARGKQGEAGIPADIYSLGAILYELLTGTPPFEGATALDVLRQVNEELPRKPASLNPRVPPDLAVICLKCLEKEPARRYATAGELADDLQCYLEHRPVQARAPGAAYIARRFVRRHFLAVTAATIALLSLIAGFIVSLWHYFEAKEALAQAAIELDHRREVARFLTEALSAAGVSKTLGRDPTMMREVLDRTAGRLDNHPPDDPGVEAELRTAIGRTYLDLDEFIAAETHLGRALALRRQASDTTEAQLASALFDQADALYHLGRKAESEPLVRESVAIWTRIAGPDDPATAEALSLLAWILFRTGRGKEAEAPARHVYALWEANPVEEQLGEGPVTLACILKKTGRGEEAEAIWRKEWQELRKLHGPAHPAIANNLDNLGMQLLHNGKLDEAEQVLREALAQGRQFFGDRSPHEDHVLANLSRLARRQGDLTAEISYAREAVQAAHRVYPEGHPIRRQSENHLKRVLERRIAAARERGESERVWQAELDALQFTRSGRP